MVYLWGKRYYGAGVASVAVLLFSFLPPVLAHAGVATVDMALAALLSAAFLSGLAWLERPDLARSIIFGVTMALAVLSKYSALVFLPAVRRSGVCRVRDFGTALRTAPGTRGA